MGNHVRLDHELAVGKVFDQDRPQQRRVGRRDLDQRQGAQA